MPKSAEAFKLLDDHDAIGDQWENQDIYSFLQAMAAWLKDCEGYYHNTGQAIDVEGRVDRRGHVVGGGPLRMSGVGAMSSSWTITLDRLVDPQLLLDRGEFPYTFLAFPATAVDQAGLPTDNDAKRYIAAVQSTGTPVGLWLDTPVEGTAYAFVGPADIKRLHEVVEQLESEVFRRGFASELSDRLFQDCQRK